MAKDKPDDKKPNMKEKAEVFVARHQERYSESLTKAREAAATTATPAWQENYTTQVAAHRSRVTSAIGAINHACEAIKGNDTREDLEKEIKDSVKSLIEERVAFAAWRLRTVTPYRKSADDCEYEVNSVLRAAENAEREQPLIERGLCAAVRDIVKQWPRVSWNDDTGVVEIRSVDADGVEEVA